jgi:hypothetical protein
MAGDGRTGEFDNGRDVNIDQQQQQLFVLVFDNVRSTADTDEGDLLFITPSRPVRIVFFYWYFFLLHFVRVRQRSRRQHRPAAAAAIRPRLRQRSFNSRH